jgi:hypothetical protein
MLLIPPESAHRDGASALADRHDFPNPDLMGVPVANDSCGGSAAVVNYRNWPNGMGGSSGVSVGTVETNWRGRQHKK